MIEVMGAVADGPSGQIVVMAGGQGSRLQPLTAARSKPSVPFGARYRIVDFVLSNLVNSQIQTIYLLVQYKSQSLIEHVRKAWTISPLFQNQFVTVVPPQMLDMLLMTVINCHDMYIFMLMQRPSHHQPQGFQANLFIWERTVVGPLQPGAFMGFPFRRHVETLIFGCILFHSHSLQSVLSTLYSH